MHLAQIILTIACIGVVHIYLTKLENQKFAKLWLYFDKQTLTARFSCELEKELWMAARLAQCSKCVVTKSWFAMWQWEFIILNK